MTRLLATFALASAFTFATGCNEQPLDDMDYESDSGFGEGESGGEVDEDEFGLEGSGESDSGGGEDDEFGFSDNMCGDGVVDAGEECDQGRDNADGNACTADCKINVCGDGNLYEDGEECDAGEQNGQPGSGCSADCTTID